MKNVLWPKDWPKYRNGDEFCDTLVGHCSCGAYHTRGEFACIGGTLYHHNKIVVVGQAARQEGKTMVTKLEELRKQRQDIDRKIKKLDGQIKINAMFEPGNIFFRISIHKESGEPRILEFNKRLEVAQLKETIIKILEGIR